MAARTPVARGFGGELARTRIISEPPESVAGTASGTEGRLRTQSLLSDVHSVPPAVPLVRIPDADIRFDRMSVFVESRERQRYGEPA